MSPVAAILSLLAEGPATNGEVAVSLGMKTNLAGAHLSNLKDQGRVVHLAATIPTPGRPARLWALPEMAA